MYVLTARVSVATADTTNMSTKDRMISRTNDCGSDPAGNVAPIFATDPRMRRSVKLANIDAPTCAPTYGTTFQENRQNPR